MPSDLYVTKDVLLSTFVQQRPGGAEVEYWMVSRELQIPAHGRPLISTAKDFKFQFRTNSCSKFTFKEFVINLTVLSVHREKHSH